MYGRTRSRILHSSHHRSPWCKSFAYLCLLIAFASRIKPDGWPKRYRSDITAWISRQLGCCLAVAPTPTLVAFTIHYHEPWADEAQSWLLARDASLAQLWGHLLHYEGTAWALANPAACLDSAGPALLGLRFCFSAVWRLAAIVLLLRYAPLPLFIRLLLPFTYYLCYQYAVVARSYALIAPLLFAIAAIYPQTRAQPGLDDGVAGVFWLASASTVF